MKTPTAVSTCLIFPCLLLSATVGELLEGNGRKRVCKPSLEARFSMALCLRAWGPPVESTLSLPASSGSAPSGSGLFLRVDDPQHSTAPKEFSELPDPCCSQISGARGHKGSGFQVKSRLDFQTCLMWEGGAGRLKGLFPPLPQGILLCLSSLLGSSSSLFPVSFSHIYFSHRQYPCLLCEFSPF